MTKGTNGKNSVSSVTASLHHTEHIRILIAKVTRPMRKGARLRALAGHGCELYETVLKLGPCHIFGVYATAIQIDRMLRKSYAVGFVAKNSRFLRKR
jgi:hypothetical protein